mgnify:CR=1 FL=1
MSYVCKSIIIIEGIDSWRRNNLSWKECFIVVWLANQPVEKTVIRDEWAVIKKIVPC